jgi:cell division septum initiation protein DivIVA
MSYEEALEQLEQMIREARSVPLSASAVIPRGDAMRLLEELRAGLPRETEQAREILDERERLLTEAHERAAHIVREAREERARLLSQTAVVQAAEREARHMVDDAQAKADRLAVQADDYADAKLANLEIVLNKLLRTASRGREQLRRRLDAAQPEVAPLDLEDSGEISGPITPISPEDYTQ